MYISFFPLIIWWVSGAAVTEKVCGVATEKMDCAATEKAGTAVTENLGREDVKDKVGWAATEKVCGVAIERMYARRLIQRWFAGRLL